MAEKGVMDRAVPILPAGNMEETARFYKEKLGFVQQGDFEGYLMMHRDNIELHFYHMEGLDPTKDAEMCYIRVAAVEALYQECQAAGVVHPNGKLEHKPWGMYEFVITDNNNNLLRFGQYS